MSCSESRLEYRELTTSDLARLREIDRSERVRLTYRVVGEELETVPVDWDVPTFREDGVGPDSLAAQIALCERHFAAGARAMGAFDGGRLVGVGLMTPEIRPGLAQLAYLQVSRPHRRRGIASRLVRGLFELALQSGARKVYVSATPSESAVGLYRSLGFCLSAPLPDLLALEPEDIHMVAEPRSTAMRRLVTTTHLEMTDRAKLTPPRPASLAFELVRAEIPCPELNRFLYAAVGARWWWYSRLPWDYARWLAYLDRPELETWVAYVSGTPAGYFELERQEGANVEIAYFGVMPRFIGKGLGGALLYAAGERAWEMGASRVWVHTCTLDHPRALKNYQARGFELFKVEENVEELPGEPLEPWPGANAPDEEWTC